MDMEEKRDIFDRLMHLPVLNIFEPFYKKHKEVLMYLFFGGITFFSEHSTVCMAGWHARNKCADRQCDLLGSLCIVSVFYKQNLGIRRTGRFGSRIFKADGFVFRRKTLYSGCGRSDPCSIHYLAWI